MKIEFNIDFHIRPIIRIEWSKLTGAFRGLFLKPESSRESMRRIWRPLSIIMAAIVALILLIRLL